MTAIDIGVILTFTLLVVGCGLSFSSSGKNIKSFFSAGGALPWWMSGLSLYMSFFSSGTFVVWGSIAYSSGWVAITIQWTMCIAGFIIGFFIAPRWQKTKVVTAAEYIQLRLGKKYQKIYSAIFLTISVLSTGAFLYPVAKLLEVSTGLPLNTTIIVLGLIILAYTAVGGLWAVIVTDILQFVVLAAAVIIVVPLAFGEIGGVANFIDKAPEGFFSLVNDEYTWAFIFAFGLYNLFFIAGNWAYVQRYTSVATAKGAKKVGWLFGALYTISPIIWMLGPMIYRALHPELQGLADEGAYLLMCKQVLPVGMLGLMLGGMIFATSSSINTTLNIAAGVITNDLYKQFKPQASQHSLVTVGRIATILLGIGTIVIALLVPKIGGIVEVVMSLAALTGGALFLPPIWLLFSHYQTGQTILSTSLISLTLNATFKFITPALFDFSLTRAEEMMVGVFTPMVLLLFFELILRTKGKKSSQYHLYTESRKAQAQQAQVTQADEIAAQQANQKGIKVIGFGVAATGLIMLALSAVAEKDGFIVAAMASIILLVGIRLFHKASR
ncbi:sodium:solute symporter family protein [Catenovulum adriaticum]|uniref:Na+:solute symporter n=1 Tax=Catenovulum adriaticum TaxID=2984846 RepID=A0ABY7ASM7_9ALTE|nr:sodium:solute symporter family protein [Catenovulum sp. TS8]WAJ72126.1 Na+:solute symporter [Catenovulum sp. TS8]